MAEDAGAPPDGRAVSAWLREARRRLEAAGVADAALEARLLVEHYSGIGRIAAIRAPDTPVGVGEADMLERALSRRESGEPVHRILGFREFYGLRLALSPETLEPRPDTETLVDLVLPYLRAVATETGTCRVLDLGTGTGAIALAILSELPEAYAVGVDVSAGAVATASANAATLGLAERFSAVESDWFSKISRPFDAILSNPPYISESEMTSLPREVADFDPRRALYGGPDGLAPYRVIASEAGRHLEAGGIVGVEIGYRQKADVTDIFSAAGYRLEGAARDLAGNDRALLFRR